MPFYHFRTTEQNGRLCTSEFTAEFRDDDAAFAQARMALADMVADELPVLSANVMAVELFDANGNPIREIRLTIEEKPKHFDDT